MHQLNLFFIIEMIGTVAFACSGGMVAIQKDLDLLGVIVLGVTTACGGGMLRDLLIGVTPPAMFTNPVYVAAATLSVVMLFLAMRFLRGTRDIVASVWYDNVLSLMDAIGLGAFTVVGIDAGISAGFGDYTFLLIFLGVITGVGGGALRDIMANETPAILKKHIYACASIAGAFVYAHTLQYSRNIAMLASFLLVVVIRGFARKYRWNLPHAL